MEKYIKIFFFLLLLGFTTLTTACVEEMKGSKNNGDIIVENNENYSAINACGIIDGKQGNSIATSIKLIESGMIDGQQGNSIASSIKLIENCENNGNIFINNNSNNSSENSQQINVCGLNTYNITIKNTTNNGNIEINDNSSNYNISYYGIVQGSINEIENCKHTGKIIVNGIEQ